MLRDVSFTLNKGEILGLFGRNGSGKSTLLKILFGTLKANEISLKLDGIPILPNEVILKQIIAYLPQHHFLPKHLKVRDTIPLFHKTEATQDAIFYDPYIASMTHKPTGVLSLGELKYLEVLILSYLPHPFIFMDEPFSMLEPLHKEKLKEFLLKLKATKGLLLTDHYYNDVLDISDKALLLKEGLSHPITTEQDLQQLDYVNHLSP